MKNYHTVIDANGREQDFELAASMMNDEIREELNYKMAPCSEQEFFDAYCAAHLAKYGEPFEMP